MTNEDFYPLRLKPITRAMIWGGRNLERWLGKTLPPGELIGETWEAWEGCVVENGVHQGETLAALLAQDSQNIVGTVQGRFPLLFKFIDAQDDLSVQVHPNDAQAQTMEGQPFGKTEAWYIIHADPGAQLILGFKENVDRETVAAHLRANTLVNLLASTAVQRGDVIFVPAGMVHAIGKGIVLAEIQENSDITYRFYDWGRVAQGRALHIEQSLQVCTFKRVPQPKIALLTLRHATFDQQFLVACRYFALELLTLRKPCQGLATDGKFHILSLIEGEAHIHFGQDLAQRVAAKRGETFMLPARLGAYALSPATMSCAILRAYVPNLQADVIEPLLKGGHSMADIARLGGSLAEHNDLLPLLQT